MKPSRIDRVLKQGPYVPFHGRMTPEGRHYEPTIFRRLEDLTDTRYGLRTGRADRARLEGTYFQHESAGGFLKLLKRRENPRITPLLVELNKVTALTPRRQEDIRARLMFETIGVKPEDFAKRLKQIARERNLNLAEHEMHVVHQEGADRIPQSFVHLFNPETLESQLVSLHPEANPLMDRFASELRKSLIGNRKRIIGTRVTSRSGIVIAPGYFPSRSNKNPQQEKRWDIFTHPL